MRHVVAIVNFSRYFSPGFVASATRRIAMSFCRSLFAFCFVFVVSLVGCGGGGGGGSSACAALKINGGESCSEGAPTVVAVDVAYTDNTGFGCSGTLISQTAVLTAAHCFEKPVSTVTVGSVSFVAGASAVYKHPLYRGVLNGFDLAIVKLAQPVPVGPTPILLSAAPAPGSEVIAYGYGLDEQGRGPLERLEQGDSALKATKLTFTAGGLFYQAASNGAGNICKGDSGGPLLAKNEDGAWGIIGVTSFSTNLSNTVRCVPISAGAIATYWPVQSPDAYAFIRSHVPDVAIN